MELGGVEPGTKHDQVHVTGAVQLSGTLSLSLTSGYSPLVGDSQALLIHPGATGVFGTVSSPALDGGRLMVLEYTPTQTMLRTVASP